MTKVRRIEWIDLAKGFCILLVMWWHIKELYSNRGFTDRSYFLYMATYFRMPLYFFLSGLFFKQYESYIGFLVRKTNKLLIPFLTFAVLGIAFTLIWPEKLPARRTWEDFYPFLPIWFLWCLFFMNNLFYMFRKFANGNKTLLYTSVCLLGVMGYYAGENYIEVLHLRSALTAMPFFVAGYAVRNHTNLLYRKAKKLDWLLLIIAAALLYGLTRMHGKAGIFYVNNEYSVPVWALYAGGFIGIYGILTLSRLLKRLPIVSYLGRYSIVVLITHYPIVYLFPKDWNRLLFRGFGGWCAFEEFVLLACIEVPIVALCVKYLPWVFAQKDVIKVNS